MYFGAARSSLGGGAMGLKMLPGGFPVVYGASSSGS